MDVKHLRYFLAIVRCGSFSRAALELNVAQPALSHHVANLEAELGVRLLNRSKRGVEATECGQALVGHAEIILRQMAQATQDVQQRSEHPMGQVVVGLPSSLAIEMTLPLLQEAERDHSSIVLRILENHSGYLADLLVEGRIDIAMLFEVEEPSLYDLEQVLAENLYLVSAPDGPFAGRQRVSMEEVSGLPLITTTAQHGLRRLIENGARARGFAANFRVELDSLQAIKRLVAAGYGHAILSWYAVREEVLDGLLIAVAVSEPVLQREVYLARSNEWPQSRAAELIWTLCRNLVLKLVETDRLRGEVGVAEGSPRLPRERG